MERRARPSGKRRSNWLSVSDSFFLICGISIIGELAAVQPVHVAAFIKDLQAEVSPPTVKQHLAAIRMLFDGLVTGHIIDVNPAHAVRWPKCVVKTSRRVKTPVLTPDEARTLLDSIRVKKATDQNGVIVENRSYGSARPCADRPHGLQLRTRWRGPAMKVADYYHFLDEYIAAADIAVDATGYLFRTTAPKSGALTEKPMYRQDAYRMIQRRAKAAGIETKIAGRAHFPAIARSSLLHRFSQICPGRILTGHPWKSCICLAASSMIRLHLNRPDRFSLRTDRYHTNS
jgi:integrase/recombinase XerD